MFECYHTRNIVKDWLGVVERKKKEKRKIRKKKERKRKNKKRRICDFIRKKKSDLMIKWENLR